ncbi:MAG: type II toxin-antitoxin system HicA family toxin [Pirellulales bacterium]
MKRQELIRRVEASECRLLREHGQHSVYFNPENGPTTAIPRYREINEFLARKICRDLGIAEP